MFYSVYFCSLLSDPNASTPTRTPSSLSQVPPPSPMTTPKSVKSSSSKKLSLSRSFSTVQMPPSGGGGGFGGGGDLRSQRWTFHFTEQPLLFGVTKESELSINRGLSRSSWNNRHYSQTRELSLRPLAKPASRLD